MRHTPYACTALAAWLVSAGSEARAQPAVPAGDPDRAASGRLAMTASTDVLPVVISAAAGEVGGTLAVGLASTHLQVRALAFRVAVPEFAHGAPAFDRVTSTGGGVIVDYFFREDLRGLWIGAGLEVASAAARHRATQDTQRFVVVAPTASVGWQFRIGRGFFIGPHAGFLYALNPAKATVGSDTLEQAAITPEVSIKLGWRF